VQNSETHRLERGKTVEGWAFTFCKAAFLALLFQRYAVLVLSLLAAGLYVVAAVYGVREWRCWVKPPWVVLFFVLVAASQVYLLFFRH
jgi:dolichol kinase